MSFSTVISKIQYNGNSSTVAFSFPYLFLDNSHLVVTLTNTTTGVDTLQTITTHYAVTGANNPAGGTVTFVTAPPTGNRVTIERVVPLTQLTDYVEGDAFSAASHETALDKQMMVAQQLGETTGTLSRVMKFPSTDAIGISTTLPVAATRASKALTFDANGAPTATALVDLDAAIIGHGLTLTASTLDAGIPAWVTATAYKVNANVKQSNKIYSCLVAHTSGTFATDLGNGDWVELSTTSSDMVGDTGSGGTHGLAPAPAAGDAAANKYLKASGAWATLPATDISGKETIFIPASAMTPSTTSGAAAGSTETSTNKVMLSTLDFDAASDEYAQFQIRMPKSWNLGTVTAVPVWTAASGTGGVAWGVQGVVTSNDDALDVAFGTAQLSVDTLLTAGDCHIAPETSAITIGGTPASEDLVSFRVYRDISDDGDTLAVDAQLLGVTLIYTTNANNDN